MYALLRPSPTLTDQEVRLSLRMMTWEGIASGAPFSLGSGGFMAAYALALGANKFQVGILAALPFVTQVLQLPAVLAVERFRRRKAIGIPALCAANLLWIPIGAVPFLLETPGSAAVVVVIALLAVRGLFAPVWTRWMRDLVSKDVLGSYHGRRFAIITGVVAVVGLGGSFLVQWWEGTALPQNAILAYSFLLIGGSLTFGIVGPLATLRTRELLLPPAPESGRSAAAVLAEPFRDRKCSQLVRFLFVWSLTSNLAIAFFAVYMLSGLGLSLPVVVGLTVLGQATNILFMRVWGPMADRVGSKTVLSLSASLYLLVILGWVFTANPERHFLTMPLLTALHIFAGIAAAGVTLTMNTLALKLAPDDKATPFLGVAGMAMYIGAGIGPIVGGLMADYFSVKTLRFDISWMSPGEVIDLPALALTGFDFLFVIAFTFGFLSLNLLVALREEGGSASRNCAGRNDVPLRPRHTRGLISSGSWRFVGLFLRLSQARAWSRCGSRSHRLPVGNVHPGGRGVCAPGSHSGARSGSLCERRPGAGSLMRWRTLPGTVLKSPAMLRGAPCTPEETSPIRLVESPDAQCWARFAPCPSGKTLLLKPCSPPVTALYKARLRQE